MLTPPEIPTLNLLILLYFSAESIEYEWLSVSL